MPDNVKITKEAIKEFLAEAEEIIEHINADLMSISSAKNIDEIDPDLLNSIFRGAHSLKGIAGMFGLSDISHLSHNLENILDSIRLGKLKLDQKVLDVLFEGIEFLTSLIRDVSNKDASSRKEEVDAFIKNINDKIGGGAGTKKEEVSPKEKQYYIDKRIMNVLTEYEEHRLEENKKTKKNIFLLHVMFGLDNFDKDLSELTNNAKFVGEVISILPSSGEAKEGTIEFDIIVGTNKEEADVKSAIKTDVAISDLSKKVTEPLSVNKVEKKETPTAAPTPTSVEENKAAEKPAPLKGAIDEVKSISETVRVDISRLDNLMNIVGELVLSKAIINGITDRLKNMEGFTGIAIELYKANRALGRKLDELQSGVMGVRMIPLSQIFEKMGRIVRKLSRESGKEIELKIFGADTELDKLIVEELGDPLMHIVRNSIDHGIELPEERERMGKSKKGTITMRAFQKGNYVVIEVEDDGKGIDKKRVRQKAIEKKIIEENDELKERDIYNILFLPGFSTKEVVSETSGRGVGMDVVKSNISKLSGMVEIESRENYGTKMILTLPITLAIIQALIIELSDKLYAIPLSSVNEIIKIQPAQIKTIEKREVIQLREETLPLLRLKDMFALPKAKIVLESIYVVVVSFGLKKIGIIVDSLWGQQDIVIKSIGETFKKIKGIAGATDLGNQKTILVLDIGALIEGAMH